MATGSKIPMYSPSGADVGTCVNRSKINNIQNPSHNIKEI